MKLAGPSMWLCIAISVFQCIHSGINASPGETVPSLLEIEIDSSANITCRMNPAKFDSHLNSSSLYFEQEDTKYIIPKENIQILNATSIVFMLKNATEQDRYYICKIGSKGIGLTRVTVGTAPLDITDFKCRGYDYSYMVCNFTKPHNVLPTKYNLSYTAQSPFRTLVIGENGKRLYRTIYSQNYVQLCNLEIQQNQGICNLTKDKNNYRANYEFYNFTLKGQNEIGVNVQSFWINHYESVIPPRPEYIFEKITNNTVIIKWHNPKYSFYTEKGLEYEIQLRPRGSHWVNLSNYEIRNNRSEYKLIVRNLPFAYFWYEISVRLRVKKSSRNDDTYWSEPYIQEFHTLACPPDTAPITDVGSFYIDSSETKVRLYWRQLPHYKENGPDFKYIIKEVKRDGLQVSLKPLKIDRTSATFPWHRRHSYTFVIKSSNAEGESPNNSTIDVPAWSKHNERSFSPQWIRNVYHATNRTSTLSWSPPHNQTLLVDYTVFWCQSKLATATECDDTIFFQHVDRDSTLFYTAPQKQDQVLNLAVSANYAGFNSGMHWTMCSADVNSELVKLEPEIIDIQNRSIVVQWSTDRVCSSLVEGYTLTYCRIHHAMPNHQQKRHELSSHSCVVGENPIKLTIPNTAKKYSITNLQPYSAYKVQMNMFSKLTFGNYSDSLIAITHEDAPSKPHSLKFHNVTSNSVVLTWFQPEHHNGLLRKFKIAYNNEHHTINCQTDEEKCAPKQMKYKLENLSSYTIYKIYVTAFTTAPSEHSNDITIKTLVGIPSNPRNVRTKDNNQNILQWSRPEVPSGRVEFYEVAIRLWFKDQVEQLYISGIIDSNKCEFHLPVCVNAEYRFTKEVRAVNVVRRDSEIDQYLFATKNLSNNDISEHFSEYKGLKCVGTALSEKEQSDIIKKYQDTEKYVQYKSVWEKGPVTNCSNPKFSRVTLVALLIIVSSIGVMAAFYVARNKYQKMANISCALPPGLEAMAYPIKDNGGDVDVDFRRSKDSFYTNENRRLLSSVSHDSGYACHNSEHNTGGLNGITSCSLDKSNCSYMASSNSTEYCTQETLLDGSGVSDESCIIDQTPIVDDTYMVMELLKSSDRQMPTPATQAPNNGNGYVQPNFSTMAALSNNTNTNTIPPSVGTKSPSSFLQPQHSYIKQITSQLFQSHSGYIKPNNLFNWPVKEMLQQTPTPQHSAAPNTLTASHVNAGYVSPQSLQKALMPSQNGYTSVEALGKSLKSTEPIPQTFSTPDEDEGGGGGDPGPGLVLNSNLPPISGYVTQKELSAFGQRQQFN